MSKQTVTAESLATLLADYQKASEKWKQADKALSLARSEECSATNYQNECRKRYEAAFEEFLKEHDISAWRRYHLAKPVNVAGEV